MSESGNLNSGGGLPGRPRPSASRQPGRARPPRGPRSRWKRVLAWTAAGLAVVIVVASIGAYLKFRSVWDSIKRVSIARLGTQPPKLTSATNILVIGSDSRAGPNR